MIDKVLQAKKDMKRIISSKDLIRVEKYRLAQKQCEELNDEEVKILLKECQREYQTYERFTGVKDIFSIFLTGIGMLITLFVALSEEIGVGINAFHNIILVIGIYIGGCIIVLSVFQTDRSKKMDISRYMIDILEEKHKDIEKG